MAPPMTNFHISAPHDSGNIEVLDASDPSHVRLNIREDGAAKFHQWFYFRAVGGGAGNAPIPSKMPASPPM